MSCKTELHLDFFLPFNSLSPSIKLDELPQPVEIGFNKECWENSVRGRDPSSLSIKVFARVGGGEKKKWERERSAHSTYTFNHCQTGSKCRRSGHAKLYRHRGMSHRYRWPGIHERRKNAKVSDHCDRNKFARRASQLASILHDFLCSRNFPSSVPLVRGRRLRKGKVD